MSVNPLQSTILKIERAKHHIADLNRSVAEFFSGNVYSIVIEPDPKTGDRLVKVKLNVPMPETFGLVIGDVLSNMRSSLDHLAVALAGLKNPSAKGVHFPFAGGRDEFLASQTQRKIDAFPSAARPIIESLQPYKGGNDLLWAINRVRNVDTHNFILPVGSSGSMMGARSITVVGGKVGMYIGPPSSLDEGVVISNLGEHGTFTGAGSDARIDVSGNIVFGNAVDVVGGSPVVTTLHQMSQLTHSICTTFQRQFFP